MRYLEKFVNYLNESTEDITDLTKEELDEWSIFCNKELGMSKYLFDYIISKFRFHNRNKNESI